MNKALRYILPAILTLVALGAPAQQTKVLTADKHNEYGLVYNMPLTVFDIEIVAQRTVYKAGPYWMYANKYLGTKDVVTQDSEQWTVTEVRVAPRAVADQDRRYLMQLKPGALTSIQVAEDGMLLAINTEVQPSQPSEPLQGTDLTSSTLDKNEYLQYLDEEFLAAQSRAKKAELLWTVLMDVRNARLALSKGTAETMPTDGRQLELMLASLQKQEDALTDAFCGTVQTQTVVNRFEFIPDDESADTKNVLCRINPSTGFSRDGEPVYLSVEIVDVPDLPKDDKGEVKKLPKDAVMYLLPGSAKISLRYGAQNLFAQEYQVAQYGVEFGLAPTLFTDKKAPSYAIFDPLTGALRTIAEIK